MDVILEDVIEELDLTLANPVYKGVGISTIVEYYALSTSPTEVPTSWSTTVPTITVTNKYLWNYATITYTDESTKDTPKVIIGTYGDSYVITDKDYDEIASKTVDIVEPVLTKKVESETERAEGVESTLSNSLSEEVTRATKTESSLGTLITNEQTRAKEVESTLDKSISDESTRATKAESDLSTNLSEEVKRAIASELVLTTAIGTEKTRAEKAEEGFDSRLDTIEEDYLKTADKTELQGNIDKKRDISDSYSSSEIDTKVSDLNTSIGNEKTRAEGIESGLNTRLGTVENDYLKSSDKTELSTAISNEESRAKGVESGLDTRVGTIEGKIPNEASSTNQLADKEFTNSSIATNTANFKGTYDSLDELKKVSSPTNNDYGFVRVIDETTGLVKQYDRYKYVASTKEWTFEYTLNNSSFTASQWSAINSGATDVLIAKISTNETAISTEKARAEGVESTLSTNLSSEVERAKGVEESLTTTIANLHDYSITYDSKTGTLSITQILSEGGDD